MIQPPVKSLNSILLFFKKLYIFSFVFLYSSFKTNGKEKEDDIPAMLSNNEFVFTADAVRAAGGGSVNKGAKKMYDLMKSLEGKVV